jgi:hypothetical protein
MTSADLVCQHPATLCEEISGQTTSGSKNGVNFAEKPSFQHFQSPFGVLQQTRLVEKLCCVMKMDRLASERLVAGLNGDWFYVWQNGRINV